MVNAPSMRTNQRHRPRLTHLTWVLAGVLVAAACTSPGTPSAVRTFDDELTPATTVPPADVAIPLTEIGPLRPGLYYTDRAGYRMTFTVGENWALQRNTDSFLELRGPGDPGRREVVWLDVADLAEGAVPVDPWAGLEYSNADNFGPMPTDLAAWFVDLPYIEARSPLEPFVAGGVTGRRVEVAEGELGPHPERPLDDRLNWVMYGPDYQHGLPLRSGFYGVCAFLDAETGPVVVAARGRAAGEGDGIQAESLAAATAILDSIEFDVRRP